MADSLGQADDFYGELTLVGLNILYESVKSVPMIVADKSAIYMILDEYSEHQRENWALSKIVTYKNEEQLREFIRQAREGKIINGKMYFGMVHRNLAERIKNETGTDIDVKGYNVAISANEIRKIFKSHGSEDTELSRGQRPIIEDDIVNIPLVIQSPDKITLDGELYEGKPVLVFIKTINGRTTILSYVSHRSHDLRVQTMYSGKGS